MTLITGNIMKILTAISIVMLIGTLAFVQNVTASPTLDGSNWTGINDIFDLNGYSFRGNESYSYLIWKSGSNYYAKNGNTGRIDYSGTNATTVIQNAINAASAGKIKFRAGTYIISGLNLSNRGIYIEGEFANWGDSGVVFQCYGCAVAFDLNNTVTTTIQQLNNINIFMDGSGTAIYAINAKRENLINNVRVRNAGIGIHLDLSWALEINSFNCNGCDIGVSITGTYGQVNAVNFQGGIIEAGRIGVQITGNGLNNKFSGMTIQGNTEREVAMGGTGAFNIFSNNYFESDNTGMYEMIIITGTDSTQFNNNLFYCSSNCTAINVSYGQLTLISENMFAGGSNKYTNINISGGSVTQRTSIVNNKRSFAPHYLYINDGGVLSTIKDNDDVNTIWRGGTDLNYNATYNAKITNVSAGNNVSITWLNGVANISSTGASGCTDCPNATVASKESTWDAKTTLSTVNSSALLQSIAQVLGLQGILDGQNTSISNLQANDTADRAFINSSNRLDQAINFVISNGTNVIGTGIKGDVEIPFSGTIISSRAFADQSGSFNVSWWKDSYANYPPTVADSLGYQYITTATKNQTTGLSQAITAGDILRFNVESATTVTRVTISLTVRRS